MPVRVNLVGSLLGMLTFSWVGCPIATAVEARGSDEPLFHIQAHRGAGIAHPENTLESFTRSWEMDVTPEADLRTTKDGVIVCFHDQDLKRVVSNVGADRQKLGIEQFTLAEVQEFDVGSFRGAQFAGQRVPTLTGVFAKMKGRPEP